jgi:putative copper export protein
MLPRPMKKALTIVIGFLHDFAAGCWGASVVAVYWLHRLESRQELGTLFFGLKKQFFFLGLGCVAVVLVAGMGRTFTYAYVGSVYGEDAERLRRKMLVMKHIILFIVFGLGIWWQYTMVY